MRHERDTLRTSAMHASMSAIPCVNELDTMRHERDAMRHERDTMRHERDTMRHQQDAMRQELIGLPSNNRIRRKDSEA